MVFCFGLLGCRAEIRAPEGPVALTLLHTNDIHGAMEPEPASWLPDKALVGGFKALDGRVRRIRAEVPNVLLLDGGDLLTGGPAAALTWSGAFGGGMFELMNSVGYDAWTLGNHELDRGLETLLPGVALLHFPTLNANLQRHRGRPLSEAFKPYEILQVGGLRVGVIGLMTNELGRVVSADKLVGIYVADTVQVARRWVEEIDPRTDLIVALTHQGVDADKELATAVSGIDVIVGGHSHTRLTAPVVHNGVVIVQAGSHLKNLGRLDLVVEGDKIVTSQGRLISLKVSDSGEPSPRTAALVDELSAAVKQRFGERLGELVSGWTPSYNAESNVGNWLTDQLKSASGAQFAVLNSGGIRKALPPGPVTRGDLYAVIPFDNQITTFTLTGAQLLQFITHNARSAAMGDHGILQVSGLSYTWKRSGDGVEILGATLGGAPIDPSSTYTGASNDYIVMSQAEKYLGVAPGDPHPLGVDMFEACAAAFKAQGQVDARIEGRIVEVTP